MEKEINPNLYFVEPEHYNQVSGVFVRKQDWEKNGEKSLPIWLIAFTCALCLYVQMVSHTQG